MTGRRQSRGEIEAIFRAAQAQVTVTASVPDAVANTFLSTSQVPHTLLVLTRGWAGSISPVSQGREAGPRGEVTGFGGRSL